MKKIGKLYEDKQFLAALSVILMSSYYPLISGWLFNHVGGFWTLVYWTIDTTMMLCHGVILLTKMFPRFSIHDDIV